MLNLKTFFLVFRIVFRHYEKPQFILMFFLFKYRDFANKQKFKVIGINDKMLHQLIEADESPFFDINNTVLVAKAKATMNGLTTLFVQGPNNIKRKVFLIGHDDCAENQIMMSHTLMCNMNLNCGSYRLKMLPDNTVEFAHKVELVCMRQPKNLSNLEIDTILKSYFQRPKLLHLNDVIEINVSVYGKRLIFNSNNLQSEYVYFEVKNIALNGIDAPEWALCQRDKSSVILRGFSRNFSIRKHDYLCHSSSLQNYTNDIKAATQLFFSSKCVNVDPIFLIRGLSHSDKTALVKNVAVEKGMNFIKVSSCNFHATVYSQVEIKMRNVFSTAQESAPCVIAIHNFQNVGKNQEGQYDERIISFFLQQLKILFINNVLPIIVFCFSEDTIPKELNRIFLKSYDYAPLTQGEKEKDLLALLDYYGIKHNSSITNSIKKTQGFLFEDIKTMIYYAFKIHKMTSEEVAWEISEEKILCAIDYMQSNFKKSLDAPKIPKVLWSDVGGLSEQKSQVAKIIKSAIVNKGKIFKKSGLLLYGPPGTGKTLIVKAIATEFELYFLSVKGPEIINMYVGQSEKNIRNIFQKGRTMSPCIIFFDELDSIAPNRGNSGGVMDRVVSQLLSEMDGLNEESNIIVIGATNRPDLIDSGLLRPGRFDKLIYIGPCTDFNEKMSVLEAQTKKFNMKGDTSLTDVIKICPATITGADFHGITSNAWLSSARKLINSQTGDLSNITKDDVVVSMEEFKEAAKMMQPSISVEHTIYYNNLRDQFS